MRLTACSRCGLPTYGSRCPTCGGDRRSLTTSQRGYGWQHQQRRKALLATAVCTRCPLCRQVMLAQHALDLDHSMRLVDDPSAIGDRIVHATCNRRGRAAVSG
jgi:hypothetical protein